VRAQTLMGIQELSNIHMNKPAPASRHKSIVFLGLAFHRQVGNKAVIRSSWPTLLDTSAGRWVLMVVRQSEIVRLNTQLFILLIDEQPNFTSITRTISSQNVPPVRLPNP